MKLRMIKGSTLQIDMTYGGKRELTTFLQEYGLPNPPTPAELWGMLAKIEENDIQTSDMQDLCDQATTLRYDKIMNVEIV